MGKTVLGNVLRGIILRYTDYGETSIIANLITPNNGMRAVLFHGIKKRGGNYARGVLMEWVVPKRLADKEGVTGVSKHEIVEKFSCGDDINRSALRDSAFELITSIVPRESDDTCQLYHLLVKYLQYLATPESDEFFGFCLFCTRFAKILGYEIDFQSNKSLVLTEEKVRQMPTDQKTAMAQRFIAYIQHHCEREKKLKSFDVLL